MNNREAVTWLINISADIGKAEHSDLWHYEQALTEIKDMLESAQPVATDTNVGATISKFIDGLEETFAYIREREGGDSVCGLCEYDGAYIGESGDWCNECPGFNRDDCFKLSDETRRKWTEEIIKALPSVQPEPKEGHWIEGGIYRDVIECYCSECGQIMTTAATVRMNFCPNCGAKMKGAEHETN